MGWSLQSIDRVCSRSPSESAVPAASRHRVRLRYMMNTMAIDISVGGTMRIRIPLFRASIMRVPAEAAWV